MNPRFQKKEKGGNSPVQKVEPLIVKEDKVTENTEQVQSVPPETMHVQITENIEDAKEESELVEEEKVEEPQNVKYEYCRFVTGTLEQVFKRHPDGKLELVRTIPLTRNGKQATRRFRLKPIAIKLRGHINERTYRLDPKEGISYKFWQKNGEWDKDRDPKKENIVAVDDDTARSLELMCDVFEEYTGK